MTKKQLLEAIKSFYGNTKLKPQQTLEGLEEAAEEISDLISVLKDEM